MTTLAPTIGRPQTIHPHQPSVASRILHRAKGSPLLRRIGFYLIALWAAITLNFLLPRMMPGDPAEIIINQLTDKGPISPAQTEMIRQLFGAPNQPLWQQYVGYLNQLIHGNLGISITYYPTPVSTVVMSGFWWTLGLVGLCTIISFILGTTAGIIIGKNPGGRLDSVVTPSSIFFNSLPYFWVALIVVLVFAFRLQWFPMAGGSDLTATPSLSWSFISSVIYHGILPAFTIILGSFSGWMISMRNMMITTLGEDYVLYATAKGLSPRKVLFGYSARNAILPSVASFAISIGTVVGGSMLTEMVFNYPGVGNLLNKAINGLDYQLMQALFLLISVSVLAANFIADSIYGLIDPRTKETR